MCPSFQVLREEQHTTQGRARLFFEMLQGDISKGGCPAVLLPAARHADEDTLVITNGFGCKEQIRRQTDRSARHLAEVLALALDGRDGEPFGPRPERLAPHTAASPWRGAAIAAAAGLGFATAARTRRAIR